MQHAWATIKYCGLWVRKRQIDAIFVFSTFCPFLTSCSLFQKKKRVKPLVHHPEAVWSNADIEFPSTSAVEDIEIIQALDALPIAELNELSLDGVVNERTHIVEEANETTPQDMPQCASENINRIDEDLSSASAPPPIEEESIACETIVEPIQPSAPLMDDVTTPESVANPKPIQYPNLKELSQSIMQQPAIQQRIILQPFNDEKLKELYKNPELELAERFEVDFISTELKCMYKEHPLYELLKKYSQSRYNLKINMLDLQNYVKLVQVNVEDVWQIASQFVTFEGTCQDNERCTKIERYE